MLVKFPFSKLFLPPRTQNLLYLISTNVSQALIYKTELNGGRGGEGWETYVTPGGDTYLFLSTATQKPSAGAFRVIKMDSKETCK